MTTVLYIHGLESGPRGKKTLALERAGYTVVAAQMPSGQRAFLRDPVVLLVLGLTLGGLGVATVRGGATAFVIGMVSIAVLQRFVRPMLLARLFRKCVAVQRRLLAQQTVDVVMGSSFGGAVALELLSSKAWSGPTVLLCPAHRLLAARTWSPAPVLPEPNHVVVVHGRQDETVPFEHSTSLVRGTPTPLIEVDDDHRLSASSTPENLSAWTQRALARAHQ